MSRTRCLAAGEGWLPCFVVGEHCAGPNAVITFDGDSYAYDANGNNISGGGRTIAYTVFDKAASIELGAHTTSFTYAPDRSRFKRVDSDGSSVTTTLYIGNVEVINLPNGDEEHKRHIGGVALEILLFSGGSGPAVRSTYHIFRDHLGSIDVIADSTGTVVEEQSFDAWGKRRNATNWLSLPAPGLLAFSSVVTTRGYTDHEMLDKVGVIHMNGRIYDPNMARFLQADPFVRDATSPQSLNRYSYVENNPLNATDPTGFFLDKVFKLLHEALGDFAPFFGMFLLAIPGVGPWAAMSWQNAATIGFISGGVATGSLRGALTGVLSAAAFYKVGQIFDETTPGFFKKGGAGHISAHGVVGGVTNELSGGKFGHGFISSAVTKAANIDERIDGEGTREVVARIVASAAVGGTVSELTGGKFANGASTAAYAQFFNGQTSRWSKRLIRRVWTITPMRTSAVMRHDTFGKFFQHKSTELWWSVDKAGHGGSVWKVFKGDSEGLHWIADADKAGDFIVGKHKGPTGQFIPWKDLHAVSGWDKAANISIWTAITVMEVIDPTTYIMSPPQDPYTHIPNTELPEDFDGSTEH